MATKAPKLLAKGVRNIQTPEKMMDKLLTHRGSTFGISAINPDRTLPMVLVIPMIETKRVAESLSIPF